MADRRVGGSSLIRVEFACGHTLAMGDRVNASPVCQVCGDTQVRRTHTTRQPRFIGTCTGPYAEHRALEPGVVNVAPGGPLTLKTQETQ